MKIKATLAAFILFICLSLHATTTKEIYQLMEKAYNTIYTWNAELYQTNYYAQLNKTMTYTGKIYYEPERLAIQFTKPYLQRLQIIEGNVLLYDAQSKTALKTKPLPQFGRMNPVEILQYYWKISKVTISSESKDCFIVSLEPNKDRLIKSMKAQINKRTWYVEELQYQDSAGNSTTYRFNRIKANVSIPSSIWKFDLPKDTQIIEQ